MKLEKTSTTMLCRSLSGCASVNKPTHHYRTTEDSINSWQKLFTHITPRASQPQRGSGPAQQTPRPLSVLISLLSGIFPPGPGATGHQAAPCPFPNPTEPAQVPHCPPPPAHPHLHAATHPRWPPGRSPSPSPSLTTGSPLGSLCGAPPIPGLGLAFPQAQRRF